ncbi:MAG: hypothetical protein F6J98_22650 [Moorea sp. SIO4G2]|uniref:hypothetical protein n=1 Tax=unclassified Moorena TaxID=2683338 RepID=UPI0013FC3A0B|nr:MULTISPECIES: hypothetical protein [unclassified Moorena]NEO13355.1 hypothetical protein [Moorena sp. SIO3E8]NEO63086.1 hypothetical protein [Moorena sp. SIO4G2]NEP99647.1 hypothetical protein [Moorena sp. SIO3F7]
MKNAVPIPDSRLPTPDSRLPMPDSRCPTPYSLLPLLYNEMINKPKNNYQYHPGLVSSLGNF